jgi:hypothetical protein
VSEALAAPAAQTTNLSAQATNPDAGAAIYILKRNGIPFYVGQTRNIMGRFKSHRKTHGDIEMSLVDISSGPRTVDFLEMTYIAQLKAEGFELLNKNIVPPEEILKRKRAKRCERVEDGHSRVEHEIYRLLLELSTEKDDDSHRYTLGISHLSTHARIPKFHMRKILWSLMGKQAIIGGYTPAPESFTVWKPDRVMFLRECTGLQWVIRRSGSVQFVDPETEEPMILETDLGSSTLPNWPDMRRS